LRKESVTFAPIDSVFPSTAFSAIATNRPVSLAGGGGLLRSLTSVICTEEGLEGEKTTESDLLEDIMQINRNKLLHPDSRYAITVQTAHFDSDEKCKLEGLDWELDFM
jgi:hypothetical protein